MDIIRNCVEIIGSYVEDDFECWGVSYCLYWEDNKIKFSRTTTSPTGETYSDGGIDTKSCGSVLFEVEASIVNFTNILIRFLNKKEDLEYRYGEYVNYIGFKPIL